MASGRVGFREGVSARTAVLREKRLASLSLGLSLAFHHPFSAVRLGEWGGPLW